MKYTPPWSCTSGATLLLQLLQAHLGISGNASGCIVHDTRSGDVAHWILERGEPPPVAYATKVPLAVRTTAGSGKSSARTGFVYVRVVGLASLIHPTRRSSLMVTTPSCFTLSHFSILCILIKIQIKISVTFM